MKVLMVSTSYPEDAKDWRGRFISDLVAALARKKEVGLELWAPPGDLPDNVMATTTPNDIRWLSRLSQLGGIANVLKNRPMSSPFVVIQLLARLARSYRSLPVDVCHVNWLQNALPLWGTSTPALISVLGSDFGLLRLPGMASLLRAVFSQRRVILAPNAEWMRPELEHLFGDVAEIYPIVFGVDDAWFSVKRQTVDGAQNWLAVSRLTKKKIGNLFDWGEGLFGEDRHLHLFGPMQEKIAVPQWVQYHAATNPAQLLQTWFPKASGLITLSRHDEGRPQVMLEAMAAGLPVIASDLPAHRDIVQHMKNGWLAASPASLKQGIDWLEDEGHNREMGISAREYTKASIGSWGDCADRYVAAYHKLLKSEL